MKIKKLIGGVVFALALVLAMGIAVSAAEVEVTSVDGFKKALIEAPTDGTLTTIVLKNDISTNWQWQGLTGNDNYATFLTKGKNIFINGNGHSIKKTGPMNVNRKLHIDQSLNYKAWIVVDGADVVLKDVVIDINDAAAGDNTSAVYVNSGSVTLAGNSKIMNGIGRKSTRGIAVCLGNGGNATFIMEDNSKITGFSESTDEASDGTSLIGFSWGGTFIMNGGEISGNTVKAFGVIGGGGANSGNNATVKLNGGKICNNEGAEYAVKLVTNNGSGSVYLGGNTQIEGIVGGNSPSHVPHITGAINQPVTIGEFSLGASEKRDDQSDFIIGCYGSAIVKGAEGYTLTADDLNNVSWADESLVLYLDPKYNGVYAMDAGVEPKYDTWVIKGESAEEPQPAIPDEITEAKDGNGETRTLTAEDTVEIASEGLLKNATIDATVGKVVIGSKEISCGTIIFGEDGSYDVKEGDTIRVIEDTQHSFINKTTLDSQTDSHVIVLHASGTANGIVYDKDANVEFNLGELYSGAARFTINVTNVPDGITITRK